MKSTFFGFINIYASGYWHTKGKPGAYDRHGAEVYPSKEAAMAAAAESGRMDLLIDTVSVMWSEPDIMLAPNPKETPCI